MIAIRVIELSATLASAIIGWVLSTRQGGLGRRGQTGWLLIAFALLLRAGGQALRLYLALHLKTGVPQSFKSLTFSATGPYAVTLQSGLLCGGLLSLAWAYFKSAQPTEDMATATEITQLKGEVARRTHQLASLHAITADLNNTLDGAHVLSTGLERMTEAVGATVGAVWVRLEFVSLTETGETEPSGGAGGSISSANYLLREVQRNDSERSIFERIKTDAQTASHSAATKNDIAATAANQADLAASLRWRLMAARGQENQTSANALSALTEALETGGINYGIELCRDHSESLGVAHGAAHVVAIRWKGEEMGAVGILRAQGALAADEQQLLGALALEVGAALQNAQLYQEAVRLADRDGLTDLLNHRVMQQQLNVNLSRASRAKSELGVIIMDLKNFKFFNDTYGHPVGDKVLKTVAHCLGEACRFTDILGRYGGDEFIALLPDTDLQGATRVCARIAARIEQEGYQQANDGRRIPIALSFGAAIFPQDGETVLELLAAANSNLEEAKNNNAPLLVQRTPVEEAQELRRLKDTNVGGAFGVLDALVTAIDNKDHYTRRHSEDVTHWATLMGRELDFEEEIQRAVRISGLLHDVGKIAVPDSVLRKPGRLNDDEFNIMQQHPVFGALIVKDVPNLEAVLGGIRHHHERYDGKGYPDKLKGETIPMLGRLLAVPDCFSAMTTERPYRKALTWQESINEIQRGKGTQFDPVMADAFLAVIARLVEEKTQSGSAPPPVLTDASQTPTDDGSPGPAVRPRSVTDAEKAS